MNKAKVHGLVPIRTRPKTRSAGLFRCENNVRDWVRHRAVAPTWVEPTVGSTPGTPDVWVIEGGGTWIELKHGTVYGDGLVRFSVRTPQKRRIETLRENGARVGLLVGFGDRLLLTCDPVVINRGWAATGIENTLDALNPFAWAWVIDRIRIGCAQRWVRPSRKA